ncbi:MAG: hypothetical protein HQ521_07280, partial [Bacteroidetes bacterium]|nr:hypothetical protein [Bacteroidota bacterium]
IAGFNQGLLSSKGIGVVYIVATTTSFIVVILLIIRGVGIYAIPISTIVSSLILIVGNIIYTIYRSNKEAIKLKYSFGYSFLLLKLASYNAIGRLGNILTTKIDAFITARYIGIEFVPILELTKKGPELSKMFLERPVVAFQPAFTHSWNSNEKARAVNYFLKLLRIIIWFSGLLFIGFLILNSVFVKLWAGDNLFAGNTVNLFICIGIVLSLVVNIFSKILFSIGRIKLTSYLLFMQSMITGISIYLGGKYFGMLGLVVGNVIAYTIYSLWLFPMKTFNIMMLTKRAGDLLYEILKVSLIIIIIYYLFSHVELQYTWGWFIGYLVLIMSCYCILLYIFSMSFRNEISNVVIQLIKIIKFKN